MTTDKIINDIMAESVPKQEAEAVDVENNESETEAEKTQEEQSEKTQEEQSEGDEKASNSDKLPPRSQWPKTFKNTMDRLKRENRELRARLNSQPKEEPPKASPPKPGDFGEYKDYIKAETIYEIEQKLAERDKAQAETLTKIQQEEYINERMQIAAEKANENAQNIPDYREVWEQIGDIAGLMPQHVQMALLEADNGGLAFYNLAKAGKLDALEQANPYQAAYMIAAAQSMPQAQRPVSNAPAPIKGARGTAQGSKSFNQMNADDLYKWINN